MLVALILLTKCLDVILYRFKTMGIVKNTSQGMLTFSVIEFCAAIFYILSQNFKLLNSSSSWPFSIDYDGKTNGAGNRRHLFQAENDKVTDRPSSPSEEVWYKG